MLGECVCEGGLLVLSVFVEGASWYWASVCVEGLAGTGCVCVWRGLLVMGECVEGACWVSLGVERAFRCWVMFVWKAILAAV